MEEAIVRGAPDVKDHVYVEAARVKDRPAQVARAFMLESSGQIYEPALTAESARVP
jgi:hypothetical protein